MDRIVLKTAIMFVVLFASVWASGNYDYQIITMFAKDVVSLPTGQSSATIKATTFSNKNIKTALINLSAQTIEKAFPDYDPADSLLESPRFPGLFAKQPALDRIYKITLSNSLWRDSLNHSCPNVLFLGFCKWINSKGF